MPIDYKKYPPNWKTEIVPRIIKRAKNCCEFCGIQNYKVRRKNNVLRKHESHPTNFGNYKSAKEISEHLNSFCADGEGKWSVVVLTIAHLDHDSENHSVSDDRLKALCQSCHLNYDLSRHKMKRKFGMDVYKQPTLF